MKIEWRTFFKKRSKLKRTFPTGTVFFTGRQGAGKSLSATHYLQNLKIKYPKLYIISNIQLSIADLVIRSDQVADHILTRKIEGEACGECDNCIAKAEGSRLGEICEFQEEIPIAFFLDEIQTVLFSAKKSVSFETFRAICQQRKALKTIIGTMQEFLDLDIRYRRQLHAVVECSHFGAIQFESWKDPQSYKYDEKEGKYVGKDKNLDFKIWKRHDEAYYIYDTFEIVDATLGIDENKQLQHQKQTRIPGSAPT